MQTCSFVVQTITPDDADDDAITLRATTWGGSVIEFTDGDGIDRSDIGQALELAYLAGVRDSGKDVDAAAGNTASLDSPSGASSTGMDGRR